MDAHIAGRVVDEFCRLSRSEETASSPMALVNSEMDILRLVAQGLSNEQIAQTLNFSPQTVVNRIRSIYQKPDVNNRKQAALCALRRGWTDLDPEE
ncbi:MAG TPA: LuxR C-terminal-related transcriptional regulator [Caldilineaceae bacterium]|nr:LuxR C-terminal-related transcriptional regulator [Caldilineaceae bacterium]